MLFVTIEMPVSENEMDFQYEKTQKVMAMLNEEALKRKREIEISADQTSTDLMISSLSKKYEEEQNKNKTILITEDNPSSFLLLKTILGKTNARILHSSNGKEAVELCKSNPDINAVLMDIQLPVMNGYDATRMIKKQRKDLPIIAQTAHALAEDEIKSKKAGCDEYLTKPIQREKLFAVLSKYLD